MGDGVMRRFSRRNRSHPTPCPLPIEGRGDPNYFASSYVAETSIRTFSSPAATGVAGS